MSCDSVCLFKVELLESTIMTCTTEVKTFSTELSELKRTYQSLEISRESVLTEVPLTLSLCGIS